MAVVERVFLGTWFYVSRQARIEIFELGNDKPYYLSLSSLKKENQKLVEIVSTKIGKKG